MSKFSLSNIKPMFKFVLELIVGVVFGYGICAIDARFGFNQVFQQSVAVVLVIGAIIYYSIKYVNKKQTIKKQSS